MLKLLCSTVTLLTISPNVEVLIEGSGAKSAEQVIESRSFFFFLHVLFHKRIIV